MAMFGTKKSLILTAVEPDEQAMLLGDILQSPARVLCTCGEIAPVTSFLYGVFGFTKVHAIAIDELCVNGRNALHIFMHRDDVFHYLKCQDMIKARESN